MDSAAQVHLRMIGRSCQQSHLQHLQHAQHPTCPSLWLHVSIHSTDLTDDGFNFIQRILKLVVRLQCAAHCCLLFC